MEEVKFLIQQFPESLSKHAEPIGLPLHCACKEWERNSELLDFLLTEQYKKSVEQGVPRLHAFLEDRKVRNKDIFLKCFSLLNELREEDKLGRRPVHLIFGATRDPELLERVIDQSQEGITIRDKAGWLPIHYAMRHNAPVEITRHMLQQHPDQAGETTSEGSTPLHIACDNACAVETARAFVDHEHDLIQCTDNRGRTPLHAACDGGSSLGVVHYLVTKHDGAIATPDNRGCIPLHLACGSNASIEVVRYLTDSWTDTNEDTLARKDENDEIALHKACRRGDSRIIEYLMEKCMGSISSRNNCNLLPVHLLCDSFGKSSKTLESEEYTQTVFKLLLAYPETVDQNIFL